MRDKIQDKPSDLHRFIGRRVHYDDIACRVVEVLETDAMLILEPWDDPLRIQTNQYGEPLRRVPVRFSVPVFDEDQRSSGFICLGLSGP